MCSCMRWGLQGPLESTEHLRPSVRECRHGIDERCSCKAHPMTPNPRADVSVALSISCGMPDSGAFQACIYQLSDLFLVSMVVDFGIHQELFCLGGWHLLPFEDLVLAPTDQDRVSKRQFDRSLGDWPAPERNAWAHEFAHCSPRGLPSSFYVTIRFWFDAMGTLFQSKRQAF